MSNVFERNNTSDHYRIERSGFIHNMADYNVAPPKDLSTESSLSSLGKNSDESLSDGEGDVNEVQSEYKVGPLDTMEALEEVLPIKRGLSDFYTGKSKSYTSLAKVTSSSSIQEIAKPENAYNKKRKLMVAHSNFFKKSYDNLQESNIRGGGLTENPSSHSNTPAAASGSLESMKKKD